MTAPFAMLFGLGMPELILIGILGVLLFGRKLPDMGRFMGKSIVEFKKGMRGLEDDLDTGHAAGNAPAQRSEPVEQVRAPQRVAATAPKFEDAAAPSNQQPQA